jgi:tetratricopeptide (TPR) repeat protein
VLRAADRVGEALALMRPAYDELIGGERSADVALVAAQLARIAYFAGERELALEVVEVALDLGEILRLPEVVAEALTTKATLAYHRPHEAGALLQEAIRIARGNDLPQAALRAQFNFSGLTIEHDRLAEAREVLEDALANARLRGDRTWESNVIGQLGEVLVLTGDWDEAWQMLEPLDRSTQHPFGNSLRLSPTISLLVGRGFIGEARERLDQDVELGESTDLQTQAIYLLADSEVRMAEERYDEALPVAHRSLEIWRALNQPHYEILAYATAIDAALALGETERANVLLQRLGSMPLVERRALVDAQANRLAAKIAVLTGEDAAPGFATAARIFRDISMPHWLGVTLTEAAEANIGDGRAEARAIFERLGARPWLQRLDRLSSPVDA